MEAPKVIISDLKGGGIKDVTNVWVMQGVSFEIPENYIDVKIMGENTILRETGRGPAPKMLICSAIDTHSKNKVMIRKIFRLMKNHRIVWSIIREIWFFRETKIKFKHFFIELKDIITPFKRDLFDSRIEDIYLVYQFNEECMTLEQFMEYTKTDSSYRQNTICQKTILCQLLLVVLYLQSRKIEHRDLTPWNVILCHEFKLKVHGLGSCCIKTNESSTRIPNLKEKVDGLLLKEDLEALRYRPPEALLGSSFNGGGGTYDMWSIGCLFAEILYQEPLFAGDSENIGGDLENIEAQAQLDAIGDILGDPSPADVDFIEEDDNEVATSFKASVLKKHDAGLNIPTLTFGELIEGADPVALDLLKKMLTYNPKQRISAEEALNHDFVRGFIDRDSLLQRWLTEIKEEGRKLLEGDNDEEPEMVDDYDFIRKKLLREKFIFYNHRIFPLS